MNYRELSEKLLSLLGGKDNILGNAACMTRLRISVRDLSIVDIEAIKKVEGVLGVVESETLQIILGPGKVNKALEEFSKLTGLAKGAVSDAPLPPLETWRIWLRKIKPHRRPNTINRSRIF